MLRVFQWVGKIFREFLMMIGGLVLFIVVSVWWSWGGSGKTEPVPAVLSVLSVPEPVPAVQVTGEAVPVCACGNGVWCEGPRGGKFCMTEAGAKRYKGGS